jgi:hypothetical protein
VPRQVHFEIPKSKREVGVFKADALTVESTTVDAHKFNEVGEDVLTIIRINPQDIPALLRWARSLYREWEKTQPKRMRGNEAVRRIDVDDGDEDDLEDAL